MSMNTDRQTRMQRPSRATKQRSACAPSERIPSQASSMGLAPHASCLRRVAAHDTSCISPRSRSGVVLIAVVGVLAILMLMSGTLALAARLAYKQSRAYSDSQSVTVFFDGLETYCKGVLHRDKYGIESVPYGFSLAASFPTVPENYMDESYDWWGEEFLQVQQDYDAVAWDTGNYGVRADTDADGSYDVMAPWWDGFTATPGMTGYEYPPMNGNNIRVRVALIWTDVGGGCADIGASGNSANDQNQGLTPFELWLDAVNAGAIPADAVADWRKGVNGEPGTAGNDSEHMPDCLDKDADSAVNDGSVTNDFLEFSPVYAVGDDRPFGPYDLADLFLMKNRGSDAAAQLTSNGATVSDFRFLTTGSAVSFMTPRAIHTATAYNSTSPSRLLNSRFFAQHGVRGLPMPRDLSEVILEMPPSELAAFIWTLDPFVASYNTGGSDDLTASADQQVIIRQIATNLKDMIDKDDEVTVWSDGTRTYYGVETVPYLAECEFAVPLDTDPASPLYRPFDPAGDSAPLGKYIKLVNPWNKCDPAGVDLQYIALDNYRVVLPATWGDNGAGPIPRLRRWVLADYTDVSVTPNQRHRTWIAVPATTVTITPDAGDHIPMRGHYLIVDNNLTIQNLTANGVTLPTQYSAIEADLAQAQECQGWPRGDAENITGFRVVHFEDAVTAEAQFAIGDNVAVIDAPAISVGICAFIDTTSVPNYMLLTPPAAGQLLDIPADSALVHLNGTAVAVDTALSVAEPIYDWFEQPPGSTTSTAPAWITAWATAGGLPADIAARLLGTAVPGQASVVQLQQRSSATAAWRTIQEAPMSGLGADESTDIEDDWFLTADLPAADSALQISDPRPSWFDRNPTGDIVARIAADGPWGDYAWSKAAVQRVLPDTMISPGVQCTNDIAWINSGWRLPARVTTGDRWAHISDTSVDDIWDSFPPVRHISGNTEDVLHQPYYTGTLGQNTTVMNIGRLTTPGDLGFLHAAVPWSSVSLGNYGGDIQTVVHLRHFMDCIAAPRPPWETRPGEDGPPGFDPRYRTVMPAGDVQAQAMGDFNNDGALDLVVAMASTGVGAGKVHILQGRRGGGFLPSTGVIENATARTAAPPIFPRFVTADFDADGDLDLAVTDPGNAAGGRVYVLFGDGAGGFAATLEIYASVAGQVPAGIATGDLDGDGKPDLVFTDNATSQLDVRLSGPGQTFTTPVGGPYTVDDVGAVTLADLDGDGVLDAATANISILDAQLSILAGTGGGRFAGPKNRPLNNGISLILKDILAADVNHNGKMDLAVLAGISGGSGVYVVQDVHADNIDTATQTFHGTADVPEDMAAADLNGDGLVDLVTVSEASHRVSILMNDLTEADHWPSMAEDFVLNPAAAPWPFTGYSAALSVTIADLDANGAPDICVGFLAPAVGEPGAIGVLLNQGGASRFFGRININTAPVEVLRALFKQRLADTGSAAGDGPPWYGAGNTPDNVADAMADAINAERNSAGGPFATQADFFSRMANRSTLFPVVDSGAGDVFGYRAEAQARFMANLITVRTDQWGVRLRVQYYRDVNNDGQFSAGDEVIADRKGVLVLDRSVQPIRTILKRWVPEGRVDSFE